VETGNFTSGELVAIAAPDAHHPICVSLPIAEEISRLLSPRNTGIALRDCPEISDHCRHAQQEQNSQEDESPYRDLLYHNHPFGFCHKKTAVNRLPEVIKQKFSRRLY